MIKSKKKMLQIKRVRSESQQVRCGSDFQQQMKCHQTFEEDTESNTYFHLKKQQQQTEKYGCWCTICLGYMKRFQNIDLDAEQKKRQKRRQYKKRQKLKIQQEKQQALKDLTEIIGEIYSLRTESKQQKQRISMCLQKIQKNQNRFYQFINAVIRQQVEAIKKQMRMCLSQLASDNPNFARVPLLYEQFLKVKQASPEVQYIINSFNKIISEKTKQPPSYHRDLDKKTFKFLLKSDMQNRNNFLKIIKLLENDEIKFERQKEMLSMMVQMSQYKKLRQSPYHQIIEGEDDQQQEQDSDQGSGQQGSESQSQHSQMMRRAQSRLAAIRQQQMQYYTQHETENTTKSSQHEEEQEQEERQAGRRRRKNRNIRSYQSSFQKTLQSLLLLQKTLGKQDDRLSCNVDQSWLQRFQQRYLKGKDKLTDQQQRTK